MSVIGTRQGCCLSEVDLRGVLLCNECLTTEVPLIDKDLSFIISTYKTSPADHEIILILCWHGGKYWSRGSCIDQNKQKHCINSYNLGLLLNTGTNF